MAVEKFPECITCLFYPINMNSLRLQYATREGNSNKQERQYLDFIISGRSLREILGILNFDLITPLVWSSNREYEKELLHIFTLRKKPELETGRIMLYVCPECGDIDCGAITATIADLGDRIVWRSFGYETGYGGITEEYANIEPIQIDRQSYFEAFSTLK
jgi:hypothetical protein